MRKLAFPLLLMAFCAIGQSPQEIIAKSIAYHDPLGEWKSLKAVFNYRETRPSGNDRMTILELNNAVNWHKLSRNDEEIYEVNGKGEVQVLKGDKGADRGKLLRNYYVFLWGLPMKLGSRSTPVQPKVENRTVKEVSCHGVVVKYEKETYTFYFAKDNYRLVAYQFFKNDDSGKGEIIHLEKEIAVGKMRLPQERSWYELPGEKFLGTDILEEVKLK